MKITPHYPCLDAAHEISICGSVVDVSQWTWAASPCALPVTVSSCQAPIKDGGATVISRQKSKHCLSGAPNNSLECIQTIYSRELKKRVRS